MVHISDIKLIRTDTTLDLSQKAEKGMLSTFQTCDEEWLRWLEEQDMESAATKSFESIDLSVGITTPTLLQPRVLLYDAVSHLCHRAKRRYKWFGEAEDYLVLQEMSRDLDSALPLREPFQKFSKARAEPRPKRGFGNSFQPAIDAPRLEPH
ncbi:hypothetical protein JHK85_000259 [Glycine max]|nr:hypothetical protein JHK85_000259 [Glycine max]